MWLLDSCDNAGIIDIDLELASFQIGMPIPMDTLSDLGDRVVKLSCEKWIVTKFIPYQYGNLSRECKAHNPVFQSLLKHGLEGYPKGINTLQDKDKDKEEDKDKETETEKSEPKVNKARGTLDELVSYALEIGLQAIDGEFMFDHWEANGWKNGNTPSKDWQAGMRKWKSQNWLPSQKQKFNGFTQPASPTAAEFMAKYAPEYERQAQWYAEAKAAAEAKNEDFDDLFDSEGGFNLDLAIRRKKAKEEWEGTPHDFDAVFDPRTIK